MVSALRTITRAPFASLLVIVVLTVSMSASVAIFVLIDAALLEPLPYPAPDRLVTFTYTFNGRQPDVWVPLELDLANPRHPPFLSAYGRLGSGVSLRQAREEDRRAADEFRRRYPDVLAPADSFAVHGFSEVALADLHEPLGLLASAVVLILVLGWTNAAGLLLVQVSGRRREMAVRAALGGSRLRIARQLLTENACLTGAAAALGAVLGLNGARALVAVAPSTIPRLSDGVASLTFDGRLAAFLCVTWLATAIACTVLPMLASTSRALVETLQGRGVMAGDSRRTRHVRAVIVGSQMALAAVLTVGAALLGQTWWELQTVDRGFNLRNVTTMRASLAGPGESAGTERISRVVDTVLERLASVPGVVEAAATCCLPLESDWLTSVQIVGGSAIADADQLLSERRISPS